MENLYLPCRELQPNGSDNERNSNYSSKDGSDNNYENIFSRSIKSEYIHFDEHCPLLVNEEGNVEHGDEINKCFKIEETVPSLSNINAEMYGCKKRQTFKCSHCPKIFSNSSAIAKHKLTHSDQRKYVCEICGKAFKRQDHLNGHKHTHKTNKPHACHLCDRSYSDARSLRRHYENQHQNEFLRCKEHKMGLESGCSSLDEAGSVDIFGILDESKCIKCDVCGKGFKNQSALNGHMRLHGGYGQTKNCITGPGEVKPLLTLAHSNSPDNVDAIVTLSSTSQNAGLSSSRFTNLSMITTMANEINHSKLQSLLAMVPSTIAITQMHNIVVDRKSLARTETLQVFDRRLSTMSSSAMDSNTLPNINMDDLCLCLSPSSNSNMHPRESFVEVSNSSVFNNNINSAFINSSTTGNIHNSSLHKHYSPIIPSFSSQLNHHNIVNHAALSSYPANITDPEVSFGNINQEQHHYHWGNNIAPYIPSNEENIQKQWTYYDLPLNMSDIADNKGSNSLSLPQISSSNNLQDLIMNLESIDACSNLDVEWCKFSDGNDEVNNVAESSETESLVKKESINPELAEKSYVTKQTNVSENLSNSSYQQSIIPDSTLPAPHRKNKCRPAPIFIPPQTSAHMSRLRSPRVWNTYDKKESNIPPYTPPPMLSPQRKGSGLFNSVWQWSNKTSGNLSSGVYPWSNPIPSNSITALSNSYCTNSVMPSSSLGNHQISSVVTYSPGEDKISSLWIDPCNNSLSTTRRNVEPEHFLYQDECLECQPLSMEDSDGLPTSATPRINIGPQYQAELPKFCKDKQRSKKDKRLWDVLLWDPNQFKDTVENTSSLDLLMKIASSPAVKSCGLNMEYTFHLLCKFKGDLEKTLQALLEDSFVVYDYVYAETTNWTTDEINKFQERLKKHDRDFMRVALDLQSYGMNKSVKACVEFYYVWKQMNNVKDINMYRLKSSRKKLITINNNAAHDDNNYPSNAEVLSSLQVSVDSGYNLRKKFPSGNQKPLVSYNSYDYKSSSAGSSRETSPTYCKLPRSVSSLNLDRTKKLQPYHCSQCKRKFAKSRALETHSRIHNKNPNMLRDKLLLL